MNTVSNGDYQDALEISRLQTVIEEQKKEIRNLTASLEACQITIDKQDHKIDKYETVIHAVEAVLGRKILEE